MTDAPKIETIQRISRWGIVGAGGAGFPTHVKLNASAGTLIVNGAECEPLLHKDKELLAKEPETVLKGAQLAASVIGATDVVLGVKSKAKAALKAIRPLLKQPVRLHLLQDIYPAGDEVILTYEVTGRVPPPGGLPLDVGVVVQNIETLYWLGLEKPVTHKLLTVAGAVPTPVTLRVPIGTPVSTILNHVGGMPEPGGGVLAGGVMMGRLMSDLDEPVTKTLGGLIVLPPEHPLLERYRRPKRSRDRIARSACDQCSFCTQLCPRALLGHPVAPHLAMRHIQMSAPDAPPVPGSAYCCGCRLCSFWSCPEGLDPDAVTFEGRMRIAAAGGIDKHPETTPHPLYEYRKPPISALKRRLGLSEFTDKAPLQWEPIPVRRVVLPLRQHVGAPAVPVVRPGDTVYPGDLVADIPPGKLGAALHASIGGTVVAVDESIVIEGDSS